MTAAKVKATIETAGAIIANLHQGIWIDDQDRNLTFNMSESYVAKLQDAFRNARTVAQDPIESVYIFNFLTQIAEAKGKELTYSDFCSLMKPILENSPVIATDYTAAMQTKRAHTPAGFLHQIPASLVLAK